jgi:hypothetical protein
VFLYVPLNFKSTAKRRLKIPFAENDSSALTGN